MKLLLTFDGSHTISLQNEQVTYHSIHGAIAESKHVFIEAGLIALLESKKQVSVFEVGFGTGLNALLTLIEADKADVNIYYETVDTTPLPLDLVQNLNYCKELNLLNYQDTFDNLHRVDWNIQHRITENFTLHKRKEDILTTILNVPFDVVYFDAFDPGTQPSVWTAEVFRKIAAAMNDGGVLVTYSSKGSVRRAMKEAGFKVEKLPGPTGKREIVRAYR